ncbi:Ig-like domain repeat protein [Nocardioides sp. GXZ039]|uniref:Ig-like domain repeat protein n=1 Tax=Nocardioides sp. GXZ039 TaxID=3136018 RepID=UPI0030F44F66
MRQRRTRVRLASLLATLVVATGVVTTSGAAPATAAVTSPGNLRASDAPTPVLAWDVVSGATGYDVEVSTTSTFATKLVSASTVNRQYVPVGQMPTGEVWWRVRAKDTSGAGEWTTASFSRSAAAAPTLVAPAPGVSFQAPQTPRFTWDPVPGATSYTVETSRDPDFTDPAGTSALTQKTTAAYLKGYPTVGDYYWHVRAELSGGHWTRWSEPRLYSIRGLDPAQLTAPADDFSGITDVVLDWEPVPGAATYEVQVSPDDGFLAATTSTTKDIAGTRFTPPSALNHDEYYWRVRPVDASGNAAPWPATPWKFRRAWPDQPTLVHPLGQVSSDVPFFYQWDAIDRASSYVVYLFNDAGEEICNSINRPTIHTTLANTCVPSKTGDYSWKVLARNDVASGSQTLTTLLAQTAGTFHYTAPGPITPASPGSLSTDQVTGQAASLRGTTSYGLGTAQDACSTRLPGTCIDLRNTPVLTWDPVPGALSYKVTISRDKELTNKLTTYDGVVVNSSMFTFVSSLPDSQAGSAYFWVIQPCYDLNGAQCAPIQYPANSFAKKSIAPTLLGPADGATVSDDVTLSWTTALAAQRAPGASTGSTLTTDGSVEAKSYVVETSVDPTFASTIETATVDQTSYTSPSATYPEGIVYWRVRGIDSSNNQTVYSEVRSFVKRSPVPVQLTPADDAEIGTDFAVSWQPLPFAKSYKIEVYAGSTLVSPAGASTIYSSWSPSSPFPVSAESYTWRVRRVDAKGREGAWSDFRRFKVVGFPPALATPAAGQLVEPTGGLFSWDTDPRAATYRFERRKPNDATNSIAESQVTRATSWAPTSALPAGTAQWRVVSLDASGKDLAASPWREFVVIDPPAVATATTISGSGQIGTELRVSAPIFDPAAETTTYQWMRETSKITGATGEVYTLTTADLGKRISVVATGTRTGYKSASSQSNGITGIAGSAIAATAPPVITGDAHPDRRLTVTPGVWENSPSVTRQWHRDGVAIAGATSTTYLVAAADLGHDLTVVETAKKTGYENSTATSNPVQVTTAPALEPTTSPAITGTPYVGQVLRATAGTWPSGSSVTRQWYRDGEPVAGRTSTSYTLTAADGGHEITVVETAKKTGWSNGTAASDPVFVEAPPAVSMLSKPAVTGTPKVGQTLTANPGTWNATSARFTYQWFRNGVAIANATRSSYTPTAADAARRVHVVVTATATGYSPASAAAAPVTIAKIASTTAVTISPTKVTKKIRAKAAIRVTVPGLTTPGGTVTIYDGARKLATKPVGTGSITYKLPKLSVGKHKIKVVYSGGAQVAGSSKTVTVKVTKR